MISLIDKKWVKDYCWNGGRDCDRKRRYEGAPPLGVRLKKQLAFVLIWTMWGPDTKQLFRFPYSDL
jgi:hypothetical protein